MSDNNITLLLRALVGPIQAAEDALQQLLTERTIDTSIGAQIDVIGKLVGEARAGLDDETYRRHVRARISANRSTGRVSDVLKVADLVVYDDLAYLRVIQYGQAAFVLRVEDIIVDDITTSLVRFMRQTTAAGVRAVVETWPLAEAAMFTCDGPGETGLGFGDALTPATGGGMASARD
jgi:hypothetical protein